MRDELPLHYSRDRGQKQACYTLNYTLVSQCCKQSRQQQMMLHTCVIRVVFHFTCGLSSESFCHFILDEWKVLFGLNPRISSLWKWKRTELKKKIDRIDSDSQFYRLLQKHLKTFLFKQAFRQMRAFRSVWISLFMYSNCLSMDFFPVYLLLWSSLLLLSVKGEIWITKFCILTCKVAKFFLNNW